MKNHPHEKRNVECYISDIMLATLPLPSIQDSLYQHFGFQPKILRADPLAQWGVPTAYRLHLSVAEDDGSVCPPTVVVKIKGAGGQYDPSDLRPWRPAWKLAQDYVNLRFLESVGAGGFVPELYGYNREMAYVLMEDVGPCSLHDALLQKGADGAGNLLVKAAGTLGRLHGLALPCAYRFAEFAQSLLPGYEPIGNSVGMAEKNPFGLLDIQKYFGLSGVPDLIDAATSVPQTFAFGNCWIGYRVGDLWHQHVMLPEDGGIRYIDFHCGGVGNMLEDLMRLLNGTPLYEKKCLPEQVVVQAKAAYLVALREALPEKLPLKKELRTDSSFEKTYAIALLNHCSAICCREWIQLQRHNEEMGQLVWQAMRVGRKVVEQYLPELDPMAELFARVEKWFEINCPASVGGELELYEPMA